MRTELKALQDPTCWYLKLNKTVDQNRGDSFSAQLFFQNIWCFEHEKTPWRLWNVNAESLQSSHYTRQTSTSANAVYRNLKILSYCTVFVWSSHICCFPPTTAQLLTSISLKVCDEIQGKMIKGIKLKKDCLVHQFFDPCLENQGPLGSGQDEGEAACSGHVAVNLQASAPWMTSSHPWTWTSTVVFVLQPII